MTDQTIPAGLTREEARAVREWAERARDARVQDETVAHAARVILDAVPAPPLPTLADMTEEERAACRWMQADVAGHDTRYVIADPDDGDGEAALVSADGRIEWIFPEYITPRPDLPRMEWPDTGQDGEEATKVDYVPVAGGRTAYGPWTVARLRKKADTTPALPDGWRLADHPRHGRVVVTTQTPNINGYVYVVIPDAGNFAGYGWRLCNPDDLTYIDQGADQ